MVAEQFLNPSLTVDAVALRKGPGGTEALLIRRGNEPWKGKLAFPGGFVDYGEDPIDAVLRELLEETGVIGSDPQLLAVHEDSKRDPRGHIVSVFYKVTVREDSVLIAGDDATNAEWVTIGELQTDDVAGDHIRVIEMLSE